MSNPCRDSELDRLNLALRSAEMGTWHWDLPPTGVLWWDERMHAFFGMAPGAFKGSYEDFLGLIHEEDRERIRTEFARAIAERAPVDTHFQVAWPSEGSKHLVRIRSRVHCDNTETSRIVGVAWDITRRQTKLAPDPLAKWLIGPILLIQIIMLSLFGLLAWLAPPVFAQFVAGPKLETLQNVLLAASAAGIGGAVFMVREYYLSVAYGPPFGDRQFLRNEEIPRYLLLPLSSFVLGPVGFSLLLAGSIVFNGFSPAGPVRRFTVVAMSFLLGFAYHDTLKALRSLSRRIFAKESEADILDRLRRLVKAHEEKLVTDDQFEKKRDGLLAKL
jgi:PAS domain S-box-containing protein